MARKPRKQVNAWARNLDEALNEVFPGESRWLTSYDIFIGRMITARVDGGAFTNQEAGFISGYMRALKDCGAMP